jgi:hypothetical protein
LPALERLRSDGRLDRGQLDFAQVADRTRHTRKVFIDPDRKPATKAMECL